MRRVIELTRERLDEVLRYDRRSGRFYWKVSPSNRNKIGDEAGVINNVGYRALTIDWKVYPASRIAWFMVTGEWPKGSIGHKNGVKDDDRWDNLYLLRGLTKSKQALTLDRLKEVLSYDPETGLFRWKVRVSNAVRMDEPPGVNNGVGYLFLSLDGRKYLNHRLAWFYMTGKWPEKHIDHINGNRSDNRWSNLREASTAQNAWNAPKRATNTSGFKGVSYAKRNKMWTARIYQNYRLHVLGYFATKEEAAAAYAEAAQRLHGDFANVT